MIQFAPEPVPTLKILSLRVFYHFALILEGIIGIISLGFLRPSFNWSLAIALKIAQERMYKRQIPLRQAVEEANEDDLILEEDDIKDQIISEKLN